MQFKGFPIAFTTHVMGRSLFGGAGATRGERLMNNLPHIGALIAGLTVAGYMSKTMKDLMRGKTPAVPETAAGARDIVLSSLVQGGAAGIYGDFLFGKVNRNGSRCCPTPPARLSARRPTCGKPMRRRETVTRRAVPI